MNSSEVWSIALSILASLGGGGAIILSLSNWIGKTWANRILEAEKFKHAHELEAAKSALSVTVGDRERKLKGLMLHYERQIEEFYGPLFNMVHQVFVANHIQWGLTDTRNDSGAPYLPPDKVETIRGYYQEAYFHPLHDEIIRVIRSKLYLIEGSEMPKSLYEYLKHAAQERDQRTLWKVYGIDTAFLVGQPWPRDFYQDIKTGFEQAMRNHAQCLEGLREA